MSCSLDVAVAKVLEFDEYIAGMRLGYNGRTIGGIVGFLYGADLAMNMIREARKMGNIEEYGTIFVSPLIVLSTTTVGYQSGKALDAASLKALKIAYVLFKALKISQSLVRLPR